MANIKFIPPQMGPVTSYSTRALKSGPLWLLIKDTGVLLTHLPYLPLIFFPLKNKRDDEAKDSGSSRLASLRDIAIQALLLFVEIILLVLFVPALISFPAFLFLAVFIASYLLLQLIAYPSQGPRIISSNLNVSTARHPHERWIFINGICTGRTGLQANVNRLSTLFGRKVTGIHNQSYGMIGDTIECLLQRCLSYNTMDVRVACEVLKAQLVDKEVKKVVLVAHSQGGIIASMVVDYLLAEVGEGLMGKLEIYTFGSAASHFHNPPTTANATLSSTCIPHIEHYANEYDMVPRWGVLYATNSLGNTNRYAGTVFVRLGATGHMFVDHYLDPIFPLSGQRKAAVQVGGGQVDGPRDVEEADGYLGTLVDIDEGAKTLLRVKGKKEVGYGTRLVRNGNAVNGKAVNGNAVNSNHALVNGVHNDGNGEDITILEEGRGKTVKELSRLWKYLGGGEPED
ncbi:MAG: hypothetical protein Q9170_008201 [Blastenia crenularia]